VQNECSDREDYSKRNYRAYYGSGRAAGVAEELSTPSRKGAVGKREERSNLREDSWCLMIGVKKKQTRRGGGGKNRWESYKTRKGASRGARWRKLCEIKFQSRKSRKGGKRTGKTGTMIGLLIHGDWF